MQNLQDQNETYENTIKHLESNVSKLEKELKEIKELESRHSQVANTFKVKGITEQSFEKLQQDNAQLKKDLSNLSNMYKKHRDEAQAKIHSHQSQIKCQEQNRQKLSALHKRTTMLEEKVKKCKDKVEMMHYRNPEEDESFDTNKETEMYKLLRWQKALEDHLLVVSMVTKQIASSEDKYESNVQSREEVNDHQLSEAYVSYEKTIKDLEFLLGSEKKHTISLSSKITQLESDLRREVKKRQNLVHFLSTT